LKKHPDKFLGRPKVPGYKDPKKGRNPLVYTIQAISKVACRKGLVKLSETRISLTSQVANRIAEVRIVPKCDCYVIEVIYEEAVRPRAVSRRQGTRTKTKEQLLTPNDHIAAIDLGIDNLMAVTSNQPEFTPLLINGRPLKSLNQFYNQELSYNLC